MTLSWAKTFEMFPEWNFICHILKFNKKNVRKFRNWKDHIVANLWEPVGHYQSIYDSLPAVESAQASDEECSTGYESERQSLSSHQESNCGLYVLCKCSTFMNWSDCQQMGVRDLFCVRTGAQIVVKGVELVPISEWPCSLFTPVWRKSFNWSGQKLVYYRNWKPVLLTTEKTWFSVANYL